MKSHRLWSYFSCFVHNTVDRNCLPIFPKIHVIPFGSKVNISVCLTWAKDYLIPKLMLHLLSNEEEVPLKTELLYKIKQISSV